MSRRDWLASGAAVVAMLVAAGAGAATITGSVAPLIAYSPYDLSTGTNDWVAYGGMGTGGTAADLTCKAGGGSFGAVAVQQGTGYTSVIQGPIKFAYDGASGTYASTTPVASIDVNPVVADRGAGGSQLSFVHTMIGTAETLQIFVMTKAYVDNKVDILADVTSDSVSVGNWSQTVTLPDALENWGNHDPMGDFYKGSFGIVTLNVSGAGVGDTLTFTLSGNYTDQTPAGWWGVGIAGATATVTAVPEPAVLGVLGMVSAGLLARRRSM